MQKGIDLDRFSEAMRRKAIKRDSQQVLVTNFIGTSQSKDISEINCGGFGRIRTLQQRPRQGWVGSCVRYRVSAARLGLSDSESKYCQVFQNAVCNFRCWFCYVDYKLLTGDPRYSDYLTTDELVDRFVAENSPARIIALSGGQPDLIPEWVPWFIQSLIRHGLEDRYFIWVDDNLSTSYAWDYLSAQEWSLMRSFPYLGRLCGLKSFSRERFAENTGVGPEYFDRQIDVLQRWVKGGADVYIEFVLATHSLERAEEELGDLMTLLQRRVHHNILLRMNPCEIRQYTPTVGRLTPEKLQALKNQYVVLEMWQEQLQKRFSTRELSTPQHLIALD